jgi:hypothetical protein
MEYEIIAFHQQRIYNHTLVAEADVLHMFLESYRGYMNPGQIEQIDIDFHRGKFFMSYADNSGGQEPLHLMLIGPITNELVDSICAGIKALYH